jgi:hypothetical protein
LDEMGTPDRRWEHLTGVAPLVHACLLKGSIVFACSDTCDTCYADTSATAVQLTKILPTNLRTNFEAADENLRPEGLSAVFA